MLKKLAILFILVISFCKANSQSFRLLNEVENGHYVPIKFQGHSVYVLADTTYDAGDTSKMALSLHSSETFLTTNALNGGVFECYSSRCSIIDQYNKSYYIPETTIQGKRASHSLYLNYLNWNFKYSDSYKPIVTSSSSNVIVDMISGYSGIIGMGSEDNGRNIPKVFSIYMDRSRGNSYLIFGQDTRFQESAYARQTLPADENWHVSNGREISISFNGVNGGQIKAAIPFKVIIDINNESILIPARFKNNFINLFTSKDVDCIQKSYFLQCKSSGRMDSLPTINLLMEDKYIHLPPNVYVINYKPDDNTSSYFLTRFKFVSPDDKLDFITPAFENYIVLGRCFLDYYYTVFNAEKKKITLYVSKTPSRYPTISDIPTYPTSKLIDKVAPVPNNPETSPYNAASAENEGYGVLVIAGVIIGMIMLGLYFIKSNEERGKEELLDKLIKNERNMNQNAQLPNQLYGNMNFNQNAQGPNTYAGNGAFGFVQYPNPFTGNEHYGYQNGQFPNQFYGNMNFNPNAQGPNAFALNGGFNYAQYPNNGNAVVNQNAQPSTSSTGNQNEVTNNQPTDAQLSTSSTENKNEVINNQPTETQPKQIPAQ